MGKTLERSVDDDDTDDEMMKGGNKHKTKLDKTLIL
jgi:hypothetical protein